MEEMIQEEVGQFLDHLRPLAGQPVDVEGQLNLPILNTLCRITLGDRFEYSDHQLQGTGHCTIRSLSTLCPSAFKYKTILGPWKACFKSVKLLLMRIFSLEADAATDIVLILVLRIRSDPNLFLSDPDK